MTAQELAQQLNGRQYGAEMTREEEETAKASGLVVIFGYSDDLAEFRGAWNDEVDCFEGGVIFVDQNGPLKNNCEDEDCPYFEMRKRNAIRIVAFWSDGEYEWSYYLPILHFCFDVIEGDEKYCRGAVFSVRDIATAMMAKQ